MPPLPQISALDKIIVAFAGPLFSFLLALVFAVVVMVVGRPVSEGETTTTIGHLEKGGRFTVKRAELAPGDWELTEMNVNMRGKALLFKTISVQQKELHSKFERVADDISLSDAANLLLRQNLVASKQPIPADTGSTSQGDR